MLSKDQNPKGSSSIESAFAFICPLAIVVASCAAFPPSTRGLLPQSYCFFCHPKRTMASIDSVAIARTVSIT